MIRRMLPLLFLPAALAAQPAPWDAADKILGAAGKDLPGDVHRYGWPRSDLRVTVDGIAVEPGLALGSWAAFRRTGSGDEAVAMGDLVLLESELDPVVDELSKRGFEVLAIHNHLAGETPRILYVHFHGHGDPAALATTLHDVLAKTGTPAPRAGGPPPAGETPAAFESLQAALGRKGALAGRVLQIGVPRAEIVREGALEIPPSMGMGTALNFQAVGSRVAGTGDFVLVADEVGPVLRELRAHGIRVTALHSHMLRETPRLFFMHFWALGEPADVGAGLKEALAKVATK